MIKYITIAALVACYAVLAYVLVQVFL